MHSSDIEDYRVGECAGEFWIEERRNYKTKKGWPFSYEEANFSWVSITPTEVRYKSLNDAYKDLREIVAGKRSSPVNYHTFTS